MLPRRKLDRDQLWSFAVASLSSRAQSIGQLRVKLRAKAANPDDIDPVLARLKDYGYLNDKKFAESFASSRLENTGFGQTRVLQELRGRRVAPALAENAVRQVYSETDEMTLIETFLRRKYRTIEREGLFQQDKDLASAYARLRRAGFGSANSIRALKKFAANPDLLDQIEPE